MDWLYLITKREYDHAYSLVRLYMHKTPNPTEADQWLTLRIVMALTGYSNPLVCRAITSYVHRNDTINRSVLLKFRSVEPLPSYPLIK